MLLDLLRTRMMMRLGQEKHHIEDATQLYHAYKKEFRNTLAHHFRLAYKCWHIAYAKKEKLP